VEIPDDIKLWIDRLYEVRMEPDKLIIMITNKYYEIHREDLRRTK
jgi:hypothetical protein